MNSNYGSDLSIYANKPDKVSRLLAQYLNNGHLSLLLGGGVSMALNFPSWSSLVRNICDDVLPGRMDGSKTYESTDLKVIVQEIKKKIGDTKEYLEIVKKCLYNGVEFDFDMARKELLIALSSLMIGKNRGNIDQVITYNFDSVLEWYLGILGLKVDTFTKREFINKNADIVIAHIHGYLPLDPLHGKNSADIVFSNEEFVDRMLGKDYWKDYFYESFRRHTFLSVGLSADSLYNDVCPYLRQMDSWYSQEGVSRKLPYGVAMLTPGSKTDSRIDELINSGIIPCVCEAKKIPTAIFSIVQNAIKK